MSDGTGSMRQSDRTRPGGWQLQEWLVVTPGLLAASCIAILLAYAQKLPCSTGAWKTLRGSYSHLGYNDLPWLYFSAGLVKGTVPSLAHAVEYPVGHGMPMPEWP